MNAVEHFASLLPGETLRRLAALRVYRYEGGQGAPSRRDRDIAEATADVLARWGDDLCGLLNALTRGELAHVARALRVVDAGSSPELRARLWERGAEIERGGIAIAPALQPRPVVLGGHLVIQARPRGLYPPCAAYPRALPPPAPARPPDGEPDTLDDLLAAADRAIGVRLGARGRDKGAWGNRAAQLLGVTERGEGEPDWRGDVELKTVAIARDGRGLWRVKEDPAIAMLGEPSALSKLVRTLWLARADCDDGDATLVAWYLLEQDAEIVRLQRRYLHARPKGPANTDQRGLYLHKRFFADAGLLAALNGQP
ncbi:MAG: hypothetical protein ACM31C_16885 [Acidobacteriota bacterium]